MNQNEITKIRQTRLERVINQWSAEHPIPETENGYFGNVVLVKSGMKRTLEYNLFRCDSAVQAAGQTLQQSLAEAGFQASFERGFLKVTISGDGFDAALTKFQEQRLEQKMVAHLQANPGWTGQLDEGLRTMIREHTQECIATAQTTEFSPQEQGLSSGHYTSVLREMRANSSAYWGK